MYSSPVLLLFLILIGVLLDHAHGGSDMVARYRRLNDEGIQADKLPVKGNLPQEIQDRLAALSVEWDELSGLLQRAIFWDTGYVLGDGERPHKVYPKCGKTMADVLVPYSTFITRCTSISCEDSSGNLLHRSHFCLRTDILPIVQCATDSVETISDSSMWAQENKLSTQVVNPEMLLHAHPDGWTMLAIHVVPETVWGNCPTRPDRRDLIIPCADMPTANRTEWCDQVYGTEVEEWIQQELRSSNKISPDPTRDEPRPEDSSSLILIISISGSVLLIVVLIFFVVIHKRRRKKSATDLRMNFAHVNSPEMAAGTTCSIGNEETMPNSSFGEDMQSHGSNHSSFDVDHRDWISKEKIKIHKEISSGSFGKVYVAIFSGVYVAVKRLHEWTSELSTQQFQMEIMFLKSLNHPNIIQFIGLARLQFGSNYDICSVCEFMELGDLRNVLCMKERMTSGRGSNRVSDSSRNDIADQDSFAKSQLVVAAQAYERMRNLFTWEDLKLSIALDILAGLVYLHGLDRKIIHRDLKSRNILLNGSFRAKLCDFGISRELSTVTSTMTVTGSNLWLSPEMICGERYDELTDVYSFGVVLSELDTHHLPYEGTRTASGQPLHGMGILHHVAYKNLRPEIRKDCPPLIRKLFKMCTERKPKDRPSAKKAYELLQEHLSAIQGERLTKDSR